jgi:hypothetical protein
MATARTSEASQPVSKPPANPDSEMKSPFIPLLWLLVPFVALIIYGFATRH